MNSMVSILMVVFNSSDFLREAIESVLQCDYSNFELIICDDCSTDNSVEIINSFNDQRIKFFQNAYNIGEYANRYKCILLATGDYFIFIDGDDLLNKSGLSQAVHLMNEHASAALGIVRPPLELSNLNFQLLSPKEALYKHFLKFSPLNLSFARNIFRTNVVKEKFKGFPPNIISGDDFLRLSLAIECDILLLTASFATWRKRPGQASERKIKVFEGLKEPFLINSFFLYHHKNPLTNHQKRYARQIILVKIFHRVKQCIYVGRYLAAVRLLGILKFLYGPLKGKGLISSYD